MLEKFSFVGRKEKSVEDGQSKKYRRYVIGLIISLTPGLCNITPHMSGFLQSFVKLHSGWDIPLDFVSRGWGEHSATPGTFFVSGSSNKK